VIREIVQERAASAAALYDALVNRQLRRASRWLGLDRDFRRGSGPYLFDAEGRRYLDLVSGYGVFFLGRGHPGVRDALKEVLDLELPGSLQFGGSLLAGALAEALLERAPRRLSRAWFGSSGSEGIEAALKMARRATGRRRVVCLEGAYHGSTAGALALAGSEHDREGFGPLPPGVTRVAVGDTLGLEAELSGRDVAAFVLEPIQARGVREPHPEFFVAAREQCDRYGTLLVADEVMTGMGRTGRLFACEHWALEPDLLVLSKALSGGFVPVCAVLTTADVHDAVFDSPARAGAHFATFGGNDLAMAAGLATLRVIQREGLVERAADLGARFEARLSALRERHPGFVGLAGRGLMLGVTLRSGQGSSADPGLGGRIGAGLLAVKAASDLIERHRILAMPAGRGVDVVRLLPPAVVADADVDRICEALDDVLGRCETTASALLDLGITLARRALGREPSTG
jgi:ornithine--oxo-acid transaminase